MSCVSLQNCTTVLHAWRVDSVRFSLGRGAQRVSLMEFRQYSDSFDGITGNEPLDTRTLSIILASISNWENLGIQLGITMQKLEEIKQQFPGDVAMCKNKLYDTWLRQQTEPSWVEIVDALEKVGENNVADKVRRFFFPDRPSGYGSPILGHTVRSSSFGSQPNPISSLATTPLPGAVPPMPAATVLPSAPMVAILPPVHMFHQGTPLPSPGTTVPITAAPQTVSHPSGISANHPVSQAQTTSNSQVSAKMQRSSPPAPENVDAVKQENPPQLIDLLKKMTIEDHQEIEITCKVYNADTKALIESTKPPDRPLTRDIRVSKRRLPRVQEFSSNAVPIGTSIRLEITANCRCYMYIINVGTSGKINMLLPNEHEDTNCFQANEVYHLPDPELGFDIEGPPGKETLQIFAFSQMQSELERLSVTPIQEKELYRDIVVRRKKKEDKKGFAQVQFDVK